MLLWPFEGPSESPRTYAPGMAHRVLVVEDEAEIASPLVRTLEREGYDVDQASTGRDAIAGRRRRTATTW